jgi:hypothetical protein
MREVALGHWHYFMWHLPASLLMLGAVALGFAMAHSLHRNAYGHGARAQRWNILGWCALGAALTSGIAWPYLGAAAKLRVDAAGTWHLCNYLGMPLAEVPPSEVREIRGVDLGGLGYGLGHLEIRRGDGSVIRSVRVTRETLDAARRALGYTDAMVRDCRGDQVIAAHRYAANEPLTLPR